MESTDFSAGIREALDRGDHAQALNAAQEAVSGHPDDAQAHRLLAAAQRATGQSAAALASIDRAIALAPDEAQAHFERAGLLLGERQLDAAQAALARSITLDPNLFGAYVLQAQLALGRGELDEADRLRRLAARITPDHPHLAAIEGSLALRRDDPARAQAILAEAFQRYPDDAQLGFALGSVYLSQGHLAFAEQAFRNVLGRHPDATNLNALIADVVRQQGRPDEALALMAPLLADPARATPGLRRIAGELELEAGHPERALPWLREALGAEPRDPRTLQALMAAWQQVGDAGQARTTLDAALATSPDVVPLWQARLAVEHPSSPARRAVIERWLAVAPDALPALEALEALMVAHDAAGDPAAATAVAERIVARDPGRSSGELRLLDALIQDDPPAAVQRSQQLLERTASPAARRVLHAALGLAQDRSGDPDAAVATWTALRAEEAGERLPPWPPAASPATWPEPGPRAAQATAVGLLWGAPGSGVERVAALLRAAIPGFLADRFGPNPPQDPLQRYDVIARLQDGRLAPDTVVADWQAGLAARGAVDGQVLDWLPFWDNILLRALRPHLAGGALLVCLRDPRDMLLDWLAFGASAPPLALTAPLAAAGWLAEVLGQVATLHEQSLYPHTLLRIDAAYGDPAALAALVGATLGVALPTPPAPGNRRFPAGHWRAHATSLGDAFALLTPVAQRLGYE